MPYNQAGSSAYGGYGMGGDLAQVAKPSPFTRRHRPANLMALIFCFIVPVIVFGAVFSLQTFSMHYNRPPTCKMLCFAVLAMVVLLGWNAGSAWRRREDGTDPKWYTFMFVTCLVAWIFAFVFGNAIFKKNTAPYMDVIGLNIYPGVDPSKFRGQQLMDAGRIGFTPGTFLDLGHSMGFRNLDTYCVAPIAGPNQSTTGPFVYDFWAVGINCCSGHLPDFHCGEYNNMNARSGLRLMRDDERAYFRLAVQQAEAAYNLRAPHPIFLHWMQDPMSEVSAYLDRAYQLWVIGISSFAGFQLVQVVIAAVCFSKAGL
uniref:Uncharacterized protein n=1 Tax=Zooxanthella nutricula TaxID=1333877 RepID=A0A7S2Q923_9DINO